MSSGFISENEIAEIRKQRQEEWEKVRKPNEPAERPEEPYDSRSLFDRLQEQKQKKELEYEEAHKLKNLVKGLDDDEIEFLDLVDRTKLAADRIKEMEEAKELSEFRKQVAVLQEKSFDDKLLEESILTKPKNTHKSPISQQQKLLNKVVITKKRKASEIDGVNEDSLNDNSEDTKEPRAKTQILVPQSALKCIGILPGLGCYTESSDDNSSDSEIEASPRKIDLLGRKVKKLDENTTA